MMATAAQTKGQGAPSTLVAIRTHRWSEDEVRLLEALQPTLWPHVAVVFHNRPKGLQPVPQVVDINQNWLAAEGLRRVPDWGWRCGDYFYYALRKAFPNYSYYWLVEPDVHFTSDPAAFFAKFLDVHADALGYQLGPLRGASRFARGMPGYSHYQAIFALTRFSGRALDRLLQERRTQAAAPIPTRDYANDEVFAFSFTKAQKDLGCGRLEDWAPDWFDGVQFATNPDLLLEVIQAKAPPQRLFHPVRGRKTFAPALAARLAGNTGFLARYGEALTHHTPDEVEAIAALAADQLRHALAKARQKALHKDKKSPKAHV